MNRPRVRFSPKTPEIRIPNERRSPVEIAYDRFMAEVPWAQEHDGRVITKILKPKADKARRTRGTILARRIDTPQAFALPKAASTQDIKGDLMDQLSELSHKVCFALGTDRCFTCGGDGDGQALQWGHFIAQGDCDLLRYHPHNTRPQCYECNINRQGQYGPFRVNLEKEKPGRATELEALQVKYGPRRWRIRSLNRWESLEDTLEDLQEFWDGLQSGRAA